MLRRNLLSLLALALFSASRAHAKQCAGVNMPAQLSIDGKDLQLNGMGLREATVLGIDVYVAGLYLEQRSSEAPKIIGSESIKHVRLVLLRDVSRADLADQLGTYFRLAAGKDYDKLKARFERMASLLPSLREGDTFSVTYRPAAGLEVRHGNKSLVTITGADFARTIFAIWLGDRPPNAGLKSGMLGGACG
jgi:hypothetical protein